MVQFTRGWCTSYTCVYLLLVYRSTIVLRGGCDLYYQCQKPVVMVVVVLPAQGATHGQIQQTVDNI